MKIIFRTNSALNEIVAEIKVEGFAKSRFFLIGNFDESQESYIATIDTETSRDTFDITYSSWRELREENQRDHDTIVENRLKVTWGCVDELNAMKTLLRDYKY